MNDFQFPDLPQIHVANDSPLNSSSWTAEHGDYVDSHHHGGFRTIHLHGQDIALEPDFQHMSSMQRYLHGQERQFFQAGYLHTDFGYFQRRRYERLPPFPSLEEAPREVSPDWSASSGSQGPLDELRGSKMLHRFSYGEPAAIHSQHSSPYPSMDHVSCGIFSQEVSVGGGGIDPRQVEYDHDDHLEQSVEDDSIEMKYEYPGYEQDPDAAYCKVETEVENCHDCHDSTLGGSVHSIRDPESVQPVSPDDGGSDSEYAPGSPRSPKTKKRRRFSQSNGGSSPKRSSKGANHGRKSSVPSVTSSCRPSKKSRSSVSGSTNTTTTTNGSDARPFACPLALYSCSSTFASKNEWKRHVSTQHIRLGFWRCDLCPTTVDSHNPSTVYYNDFNRKDLFTQHLRRMHAAPTHHSGSAAARNAKSYPVTEDNIVKHQERCYRTLRSAPPRSTCLFCGRGFSGSGSWDERMEHVGRHMEKERKAGGAPLDISDWKEDQVLKKWLISEGLIEQDRSGGWKLGDGRPRRDSVYDEGEVSESDDENHRSIKVEA